MESGAPTLEILAERVNGIRSSHGKTERWVGEIDNRLDDTKEGLALTNERLVSFEKRSDERIARIERAVGRFTLALWTFTGAIALSAIGIIAALLSQGGA